MAPTSAIERARFTHTLGGWLPALTSHINDHIKELKGKVSKSKSDLLPSVKEFRDLIYTDGRIYASATTMIEQAKEKYQSDMEDGEVMIQDIDEMISMINVAIQEPPPFNDTALVAFPINAIFDLVMATPSGYAFFAYDKVNSALSSVLNTYGSYLSSEASLSAFAPGSGWLSQDAMDKLGMEKYVQPDHEALGWGYQSWNDWFIRKFKPGLRPIACPDDPKVIVAACESTPYKLQNNVQLRDSFWAKNQKYSLAHMLDSDSEAKPFVGGTVLQAFLSAFEYHRWHSPIDGEIISAEVVPGTYYSQTPTVGLDHAGPDLSQGFISSVAARAVIKIRSKVESIGDMYFIGIGMAEVSTNIITVKPGQCVKKGDELGYFQFGGSTHVLIFRKDAIATWDNQVLQENVMPLGSMIATAN